MKIQSNLKLEQTCEAFLLSTCQTENIHSRQDVSLGSLHFLAHPPAAELDTAGCERMAGTPWAWFSVVGLA